MNKKITQPKVFIKALALLIAAFFVSGMLSAQTYCTPTSNTNGSIYYIANVTTTGGTTNIDNSSVTTSPDGYSDYTSMNVTAAAGGSFFISATADDLFTYKWAIWIDWNQDGDFDEADETVYSYLVTDGGLEAISATVTVPETALPGNTRMRIRILRDWSAVELTPCDDDLYGEVEDYTMTVGSAVNCDGAPDAGTISLTSNVLICGDSTNLSLNGSTIAGGIIRQWQYNTSGTWIDFGTGALTQTTMSITQTTQFRCVVSCTNTGESIITQPVTVNTVSLSVYLGDDTTLCSGSTLTLDPGTNPGATYSWNTGATTQTIDVTTSGTYSVTVTNGACSNTDEIAVSFVALPTVDDITVTGLSPEFSFAAGNPQNVINYFWDFGDDFGTSTAPSPNYFYTPGTSPQIYTVTLIVTNDCGSDTVTTMVTVMPSTGINDMEAAAGALKLYPNPAQQTVTLQNESGYQMKHIVITNMLGQQLLTVPVEQNDRQTISLSGLASGLYQVIVGFEQGNVVKKLEVIR